MAKVVLSGLDSRIADQLTGLLAGDRHKIRRKRNGVPVSELQDAHVVFVGGEPTHYLSLLRRARAVAPELCLVVVARYSDTAEWLEALDAGATDYWSGTIDRKLVRSLIASAVARRGEGGKARRTVNNQQLKISENPDRSESVPPATGVADHAPQQSGIHSRR
jgi:DNA-binding NarL/FixJ family response regulator